MSLTNVTEGHVLNWLTGNSTTAPTLPLMVRLMTSNGSDAAAGTEVVGGSYTPQSATFGAAPSGGPAQNTNLIRFDNMPSVTVVGFEIWDSAGTALRWHWAAFGSPVVVAAGEPAEFAIGALDLTAD
jgi:hypothetical protein